MRSWPALEVVGAPGPPGGVGDFELVQAALLEHDVAAIDEDASRVFFHTPEARDRAATALRHHFPTLAFTPIDVPDEDWAARSQAELKAIRVGNIVVAPPWDVSPVLTSGPTGDSPTVEDPNFMSGVITVVIQPSMGFGTGHHATTRLCLAHLQQLDARGLTVIDVGTGSGVLAIAANRLGAAAVLAIDDDGDAIASARDNIALNPGVEVTLGTVDLRTVALPPFDLVLANLTGGLLVAASRTLLQLTTRGGRLILSGFMEHEEAAVLAAFPSCEVERRRQEDEWVCVTLRAPSRLP